jgi:hypothetical protein
MKLWSVALIASIAATVSCEDVTTSAPALEKRYQKVRLPKTTTTSSSSETPKPWRRTIYSDINEIVTPTVVEGVTFSAKPSTETGYPQPWISLDKNGSPKTITPVVKNGRTQKASPTYSTYFQRATTVTYSYEQLKAHNMDPEEVHQEVEFIDEDKTYVSLDPLIRCTPDRYFRKGIARDVSSEPFCTPHENVELKLGKTYFITWFPKFFDEEVEKVRLHFSYVKESIRDKGMKKRDVDAAFFTTDWIDNFHGFYPFEIQEEWLLNLFIQNVAVTIQPSTVADDEFDLLERAVKFKIMKGPKIAKKNKETRRLEDEGISNDSAYYIMLSIPSVVAVVGLCMYLFVYITKNDRDFSAVRSQVWKSQHKVLGKFKPLKKNKRYSELPQFKKHDNKLS